MAIVKISDLPLVDAPVEGTDLFVVVQDNVTKKAYASDIQTYVGFEEVQTATAGQTVFNLTQITYAAGANNLQVFVDGVNQYEGSSYTETDNNTVTFSQGLHEGALVKFSTVQTQTSEVANAGAVTFLQAGTGAVPTNVQAKLRETVSVKDFGAQGDGVTDDTAAIQAALDYCEINGYAIQGVPGTYLITNTLVINCSGDMSAMMINVDATSVAIAVRVGSTSGGDVYNLDLTLPKLNNTAKSGTGWSGFDTSIGALFANLYQSRITVPYIYNFGVGMKVGGYGSGNVYNTYNVGVLFGNKINQQLLAGDGNGWSNQNTYIGGRYAYSSSEGTAVSGVVQIQLRDYDTTSPIGPNTNVWINPSVEGNVPEFHFDIQGAYNTIISPRLEASPARINFHAVSSNETVGNNFIGGYVLGVTYSYSGAGTSTSNGFILARGSNVLDGSGYNTRNTGGNTQANPHFQGFPAAVSPLGKDESATDWTYRIFGNGFSAKGTSDTYARVAVDNTGWVFFGPGSSALQGGFRYNSVPNALTAGIDFAPDDNGTLKLGTSNRQWAQIWASVPTYADNAAAISGGLSAGAFYKTATGEVRVVV